MTSNYLNYFRGKKLYQWDEQVNLMTIQATTIDGNFCLDKAQMDIFIKFKEPTVEIGNELKVKEGKAKAKLKISSATLVKPNIDERKKITVQMNDLKRAKIFVAKDGDKESIKFVNISKNGVCATNTITAINLKNDYENDCNILIPTYFIEALEKNKIDGEITLQFNDNTVSYFGPIAIISRIGAGVYPSLAKIYDNILPNQTTLSLEELKSCLSYSTNVEDIVTFENDKLTISNVNYQFDFELSDSFKNKKIVKLKDLKKIVDTATTDFLTFNYSEKSLVKINDEYVILCLKIED